MATQIEATLVDGVFKPDFAPEVPEGTRVRLTVEPIEGDDVPKGHDAFEAMMKLLKDKPLRLGGVKFNRDDLYDRN